MLLSNTVYSGDCLKLKSCVEQWLAEENVTCVDEVEAARVGSCMEKKHLSRRVFFERCYTVWIVNGGVADAESSKCVPQDVQEVTISGFC